MSKTSDFFATEFSLRAPVLRNRAESKPAEPPLPDIPARKKPVVFEPVRGQSYPPGGKPFPSEAAQHRHSPSDIDVDLSQFKVPEPSVPRAGDSLGRYKIVRLLGDGAFSKVMLAVAPDACHQGQGQRAKGNDCSRDSCCGAGHGMVALKLVAKPQEMSERFRVSLEREVRVLKSTHHASLVALLEEFTTPDFNVLALEYCEGGELFDLIKTHYSQFTLPLVQRIIYDLVDAVSYIHSIDLVHRDIKLENILLTRQAFTDGLPPPGTPYAKLTDFGLSRFVSSDDHLLTTRCGSESYAAPELILGKPYNGKLTDSWALGVVIYSLLVQAMPFVEDERDGPKARRRMLVRIAKGAWSWPKAASPLASINEIGQTAIPKENVRAQTSYEKDQTHAPAVAYSVSPPTSHLSASLASVPAASSAPGEDILRTPPRPTQLPPQTSRPREASPTVAVEEQLRGVSLSGLEKTPSATEMNRKSSVNIPFIPPDGFSQLATPSISSSSNPDPFDSFFALSQSSLYEHRRTPSSIAMTPRSRIISIDTSNMGASGSQNRNTRSTSISSSTSAFFFPEQNVSFELLPTPVIHGSHFPSSSFAAPAHTPSQDLTPICEARRATTLPSPAAESPTAATNEPQPYHHPLLPSSVQYNQDILVPETKSIVEVLLVRDPRTRKHVHDLLKVPWIAALSTPKTSY